MIIGVTGTISSGKGTFCKYVGGRGYKIYGFGGEVSDFIKEDLDSRGPLSREMMQFWGARARIIYGSDVWDSRIIKKIENSGS
jgi:dephospho-CoA kinase